MPVYVLFFCVAGANLQAEALAVVWLPATIIATVRGLGLYLGSRLGARLTDAPVEVQRFAGYGLLPQAGLAQALALLFGRTFPEFSAEAGTLVLAVVTLNVLFAPIFYRLALTRSGEAGRQKIAEPSDAESDAKQNFPARSPS